jgi:hypothetical protein
MVVVLHMFETRLVQCRIKYDRLRKEEDHVENTGETECVLDPMHAQAVQHSHASVLSRYKTACIP